MHRFSVLLLRKSFAAVEIVLKVKSVLVAGVEMLPIVCCRLLREYVVKAPLQFKKIIIFDSLLHFCRPGSECRFKARQPSRFGDGMQPH